MSGILNMLIGAGPPIVYNTDVFSPNTYTGTGAAQTITTGVNLSDYGGLVWVKDRVRGTAGHGFFTGSADGSLLLSPSGNQGYWLAADGNKGNGGSSGIGYTASGFTLGTDTAHAINNFYVEGYVAYSFRKQPKFFDIVRFTTDSNGQATFNHSLGSTPGMIIFKRTNGSGQWFVYHRSTPSTADGYYTLLDSSATAQGATATPWCTVSDTSVTAGALSGTPFGATLVDYVAYIFAHEAGGFGPSRNLNVVSCGTYTGNGSSQNINCNFAASARFAMVKRTDSTDNWYVFDSARGLSTTSSPYLITNSQAVEANVGGIGTHSTGFALGASTTVNANTGNYIYLAVA